MTNNPMIKLNDGADMPTIGFGVLFSNGDETVEMVKTAIGSGYRLIDTAAAYRNEAQVGEAIRQSDLDRSELFVTTKLFLADYGYDEALRAFDTSLDKLGLEYLDLYLLHWPVPRAFDATLASWRALEDLQAQGRVRSIGVCNFNPDHMDRLIAQSRVVPAVNQIELHPYFAQPTVRAANAGHGIATQAWSPIGGVNRYWAKDAAAPHDPLADPVITGLATKHHRTPAQIVLRWHLQHGNSAIPKSSNPDRIRQNIDIFDFQLSPAEMAAIDLLDSNMRGGPDPEVNDLEAIRSRTTR